MKNNSNVYIWLKNYCLQWNCGFWQAAAFMRFLWGFYEVFMRYIWGICKVCIWNIYNLLKKKKKYLWFCFEWFCFVLLWWCILTIIIYLFFFYRMLVKECMLWRMFTSRMQSCTISGILRGSDSEQIFNFKIGSIS